MSVAGKSHNGRLSGQKNTGRVSVRVTVLDCPVLTEAVYIWMNVWLFHYLLPINLSHTKRHHSASLC